MFRTAIYLGSAACAEFIADCFLCPLEACRIRAVSDPTYANGLAGVGARLLREEGSNLFQIEHLYKMPFNTEFDRIAIQKRVYA